MSAAAWSAGAVTFQEGIVDLRRPWCGIHDETVRDHLGNSSTAALFGEDAAGHLVIEFVAGVHQSRRRAISGFVGGRIVGPLTWPCDAAGREDFWHRINWRYNGRPGNRSRRQKLFYHQYFGDPLAGAEVASRERQRREQTHQRNRTHTLPLDELGQLSARLAEDLCIGRSPRREATVHGVRYLTEATTWGAAVTCDGRWLGSMLPPGRQPATATDRQRFVADFEAIEEQLGPRRTPAAAEASTSKARRLVEERGLG